MTTSGIRANDHPVLRADVATQKVGNEAVAWPDGAEAPTHLDPFCALLSTLLDGSASVTELITDVREVLEVPAELAQAQVKRALATLSAGRLLEPATYSSSHSAIERRLLPQPDW